MRRFSLLLLCFAFSLSGMAKKNKTPNIVFVFIDDLGWRDVGCYGAALTETPHIDQLRSEGMKFTNAYASPVCSATRASLISGQNSARNGVWEVIGVADRPYAKVKSPVMAQEIPEAIETFGDLMNDAGYACAHVGKWHCGRTPKKEGFISLDKNKIVDEKLKQYAEENKEWEVGGITAKSIEFIREHKDKPFMVSLHHHAVHVPILYRQDLGIKYRDKIRKNGIRNVNPYYAAMTEMVDESVGVLMAELDRLQLRENTVVIFYSDNGGLVKDMISDNPLVTSNLPLRGQKGGLYEGGIRVPLLVRWPGEVEAGSTCDAPVMSYDLSSTFIDIAGLSTPKGQVTDGESFVPLVKQEKESLDREAIYWHFPTVMWTRSPSGAIRKGDYKLIEDYETGKIELYNLANDLGEEVNIAQSNPEKARELLNDFRTWRKEVGAEMPIPNPDFDPTREQEMGHQAWW